MTQAVRDLVDEAVAGRPVYISAVRDLFEAMPASRTFRFIARLVGFDGDHRVFTFTLPRFAGLEDAERGLVIEYVLAGLYNIISTVGGRGLSFEIEGDSGEGDTLTAAFAREFGIDHARLDRPGYGRAVNVSERMDEAISPPGVPSRGRFHVVARWAGPASSASPERRRSGLGISQLCELSTGDLDGVAICGMDIGGTDIKLSLSVDGQIVRSLEFDWFPAAFTTIDEIIDPVLVLVRLMRLEGARANGLAGADLVSDTLRPAFANGATIDTMREAAEAAEARLAEPYHLDAIGVCFPDVVVRDKIVGGEVYKTRGMRAALGPAYEAQFQRLSGLDVALRDFVKPSGVVGIINDGPMAAFTAAVELGAADPATIGLGVFAHTLGTELGTGWITEDGTIPDIPLEIYNCIIDLGSYPERRYAPDDIRSVLNFNTRLAGTLQKYTSQSGVFRLAAKYLPDQDPELFDELLASELLAWDGDSLIVPTEPRDMRKPLLERLMQAVDQGDHPAVKRIFREVGEFLGVAWLESKWLLDPATDERILFGRLVKRRGCFDLMVEGGCSIAPDLKLVVADDELANTDLMRQLRDSEAYTVAQFAQAIGAIHYANFRLRTATSAREGAR
jgi:hypothetical protein